MFVVLSAGMLTALTATMISQGAPVFAEKTKCEDNGNNNCNEVNKKIEIKNDCGVKIENEDRSDDNSITGDQTVNCQNSIVKDNNENDVSNEPGDVVICHRPTGNPTQSQTLSLSQNAADSHLEHHPFDTTGPCPT